MHELQRPGRADGDPDKTKPPTRVESVWAVTPGVALADEWPRRPAAPRRRSALTKNDTFALYRAARDCMSAGAYTGAVALLRRLILHVAVAQGHKAANRQEAERLLAVAETLLGLRGPDRRSDA